MRTAIILDVDLMDPIGVDDEQGGMLHAPKICPPLLANNFLKIILVMQFFSHDMRLPLEIS